MTKLPMRRIYNVTETPLSMQSNTTLNRSLPKKTVNGLARSWRVMTVPLSSSLTKVRERPDIDEKKMMIHNTPESISGETFSLPMEKRMMERVVMTNINKAFNAYRV